jgi:hypothetical protein
MSSKLLIDEYPLQVLPGLATKIGLNEAIFLQQLHYWLTPTINYRPHYKEWEGKTRPWIYNTYEKKTLEDGRVTGWQANFPFWSTRTIMRIVDGLQKQGLLIVTDKFNTHATNRTQWYTIDYDKLKTLETSESDNLSPSKLPTCHSPERQDVTLMTETTTETTSESGANAADDDFEQWLGSSRGANNHNGSTLLKQFKSDDPEQRALAQMTALGVVAKEHGPVTGREKLELAQWRINDDRIRDIVAIFLEATPLPVPVSKDERGLWLAGAKEHLAEFGMDKLAQLYKTAWDEYMPGILEGDVDITHPKALTKKMRAIRNRAALQASTANKETEIFIDPDTGEEYTW